jgi:hypothetical protein
MKQLKELKVKLPFELKISQFSKNQYYIYVPEYIIKKNNLGNNVLVKINNNNNFMFPEKMFLVTKIKKKGKYTHGRILIRKQIYNNLKHPIKIDLFPINDTQI